MSIAISADHEVLAGAASDFLGKRDARGWARAMLEAEAEELPDWWDEMLGLGWQGVHLPEAHGGSGYGLEELVVVIEELGRVVAPGPFVPSVIASAVIARVGDDAVKAALLPGFATGSTTAGVSLGHDVTLEGRSASGTAVVLSGGFPELLVLAAGDDAVIVEARATGVTIDTPRNLDGTRRSLRVTLNGAPVTVLAGGGSALRDIGRVVLSAEAVGLAAEATDMAAAYAKERRQFGRVIGTFQAVKHHCANMAVATELATSAVWDAARAASTGGDELAYAAAVAAILAAPAADLCANLNTQVHGGIAITWEHDAHLYTRRATTLLHFLDPDAAARDLTELTRRGVKRAKAIELPPESEPIRVEVRAFAQSIKDLPADEQLDKLIETGHIMPHWPKPYGRQAGPIEQLVIEQEFTDTGIKRPNYGITAWNILTLVQYANQDQLDRWVLPALKQDVVWCQLFSEPDAGSDAAGVKTKATRVDGGWVVNGQKVWTSGAHHSGYGFATVRTNPDVPKHKGITMMVIDMYANGVEVRPLRQTSGDSEFNEVFFNDVFVPDDDVVGPVDGGWTVARATLGNESVSIGGMTEDGWTISLPSLVSLYDAHPERLPGGAERLGRQIAQHAGVGLLNLRSVYRAVAASGPGPEGAMTKLVHSEMQHESVAMAIKLNGPDTPFTDGPAQHSNFMVLVHRGGTIAGGTSEIKRNQIGERILGLPRDPLIS